ncbi:MAG: diphosphomevalonate decarboxylase [Nonlabens sp.]
MKSFELKDAIHHIDQVAVQWKAPSNIALVKYWGKREVQIPANPSLSFTLDHCHTVTSVKATKGFHGFTIAYDGKPKPSFEEKIKSYFQRIKDYSPWITQYYFEIDTINTFPHSSGIASSASSMAALSCCITDIESQLTRRDIDLEKASFLARLGSGSACRSVAGAAVMWGNHAQHPDCNNLYGVDKSNLLHNKFRKFKDAILLVDKGEKVVSSTVGHGLMNGHTYAPARFEQAHNNIDLLVEALLAGDYATFIKVTESEALTLHAMMMTSHPYFILMKPNTLSIIEEIWAYRSKNNIPVCFTLDAGANVHLLYPEQHAPAVEELIKSKLAHFCQNGHYICDQLGQGATKLT